MRKVFIVLTAVMILSISAFAQLSGPLSGIIGPGTYNVVGNISVEEADSLTIAPGTDFNFDGHYKFGIYGYLYAVGTEADSIRFKPSVPDSTWGGIDFDSTANNSSSLGYCLITGGYASEEHPEGRGGGILCNGSSPTISNCLIIENVADWLGGGIYCYYSSPTIENCVIKHNLAGYYYGGNGGGICCYYSASTIKNCIIEDNIADDWGNGGGIYCYGSSYSPTIDSCIIRGNIADKYGGGIFCDNSPTISNCTISGNSTVCDMGGGITCIGSNSNPTIENCTISDNSAVGDCGGIYCIDSNPTISNCTISGNSTTFHGGGIYCVSSSPTISYCTISGNTAGYDGGGVRCLNSTPTISNCTISGNSAALYGGGIYTINSNLTIVNTIVEGNMGYGGIYFYGSSAQNSSITYSDFYNNQHGSFTGSYIPQWLGIISTVNANGDSCDIYYNIFEDPLLEDPVNGNYQITWANYPVPDSTKSPCIDAGDPNSPPDPDSTITDMGSLYFDQRRIVTITLTPYNPPIIIPETGGDFDFNIAVTNNDTSSQSFNIWCMATLPNGSFYGPVLSPVNITMPAGASNNRDRTQDVPPAAPAGDYTYTAYVGIYPDTVWSSDSFPFEKLEAPDTLWTQTFGGSSCDCGWCVQQTDDGGYIIAGVTHSYGSGDNDIWLIKTDAVGDCTWSQTFGGNGTDVGRWVQQTQDGGYIIVGCTNSYGTGTNDFDVYLIKTDEWGNEQWIHTFGDSAGEFGECVQQSQDGDYIISGKAAGTTSVWDVLLLKTDQSGNEIWTHTFNVNYADCGETVRQTQDGGYIIAGWTDSGNSNALLIKTDYMGNETWHHTYGGGGFDTGECGQQTQDGGYVIVGWTNSFGAGSYDFYLIKTDESGNELWSQTFGGRFADKGLSVQQTQDNGYIITGWTDSYGAGGEDVYLIKTDEAGNEQWTQTYGGSSQDIGWSVQQTADEGYIIAGYTYSFGAGSNDVYLIRIGSETVTNNICADFMREEGVINIPVGYSLFPNHPNPFNKATNLTFDLPKAGDVSLIIYDVQGREVAKLVDGFKQAGMHETVFDASGLSSGIYFARLQADGFSQTRKLLLVK